jgi:putative transposase
VTYRLHRYYGNGHLHFITCSCRDQQAWLGSAGRRDLFLKLLEEVRQRYLFVVVGYVVMPEHFHLLIGEPEVDTPSIVMQVLKQRFGHQVLKELRQLNFESEATTVWQRRFYDFNVWTREQRIEKLRYIHRNPVKRGLVGKPEDWTWSSFRHYALAEVGPVEIESRWTVERRNGRVLKPLSTE